MFTTKWQISPRFTLRPANFELQAIFDTSVPNHPEMTFNATRAKVLLHLLQQWSYMGYNYPWLPISVCFAFQLAGFDLQVIVRQVHRMTPNDLKQ